MAIVNLTPHDISIYDHIDVVSTPRGYVYPDTTCPAPIAILPASGIVARATQSSTMEGDLDGIPLVRTSYGAPVDLPEPQADTFYVVSALTLQAAKSHGRTTDDLLTVVDAVRDSAGRVVGCCALARG